MLQDALEQPLHEPGSVQGRLRTNYIRIYLKTSNVKTISMEPRVTTDRQRVKTMKEKTEVITPMSRKTDMCVHTTNTNE